MLAVMKADQNDIKRPEWSQESAHAVSLHVNFDFFYVSFDVLEGLVLQQSNGSCQPIALFSHHKGTTQFGTCEQPCLGGPASQWKKCIF